MIKMKTKPRLFTLLILGLLLVPMVNAFTIDGPTNFEGSGGGIVRFGDTFTARQLSIVNTLNQFTTLGYGGNRGTLAFNCDTGVNMTILSVGQYSLQYNVSTLLGTVDTYVHYNNNDRTPAGTNTDNVVYNQATEIATVTTTGNGVIVTLNYATLTDDLNANFDIFIAMFPLIAFLVSIEAHKRDLISGSLMAYVMVIAAVGLLIVAMRAAGF